MKEMNEWKLAVTVAACCGIYLTVAPSASADYVGVTTVNKDDPDTEFLCTQGNGIFVPGPLTVCNVYAVFDDPDDLLLNVGNADLQVYNGAIPDVFFQQPPHFTSTSPPCPAIPFTPDLICDSFVTIGLKCGPAPPDAPDGTSPDRDFDASEFAFNGHIVGGWKNGTPYNGQGEAGTYPDLQVLFVQSSVAQGLSLFGDIDIFWLDGETGEVFVEVDAPIECAASCPDDYPCDDGDACTENDQCIDGVCTGLPIGCDDGNDCTDDTCEGGMCIHTPVPDMTGCDDGDACTYDDYCDYGVCYGYAQWCTDNDDCTIDYCDPDSGCVNEPIDCDDSNPCTDDSCDSDSGQCVYEPNDNNCDDGDPCTEDLCDPDTGCMHEDVECPEGQVCDPASGGCVVDQDPCECVHGRVTLCHIPPGNLANAHTITVGCAARNKHLAHGDTCGPCG